MLTFNRQNPILLEDLFQETIKQQRTWLILLIIIAMKWDTCSFCKVPPFDVLHHIPKTKWSIISIDFIMKWWLMVTRSIQNPFTFKQIYLQNRQSFQFTHLNLKSKRKFDSAFVTKSHRIPSVFKQTDLEMVKDKPKTRSGHQPHSCNPSTQISRIPLAEQEWVSVWKRKKKDRIPLMKENK